MTLIMIFKSSMSLLRLSFVIFFTSCLLYLQVASANGCAESLDIEAPMTIDEQFERVDGLSKMKQDITADIYSFRGLFERENDQRALEELDRILLSLNEAGVEINLVSEKLIEDIKVEDADLWSVSDDLTQLSMEAKKIRYGKFEYKDNTFDTFRLSHLQANPQDVVPNTVYKAQSYNGDQEISFLFSNGLVKELFHTNDNLLKAALENSLASIRKGLFPGKYRGDGIIKIIQMDKGFVEIRQRKKESGQVRIYGYTHEGVLHFVYWSKESGHGASALKAVNSALRSAQTRRGH